MAPIAKLLTWNANAKTLRVILNQILHDLILFRAQNHNRSHIVDVLFRYCFITEDPIIRITVCLATWPFWGNWLALGNFGLEIDWSMALAFTKFILRINKVPFLRHSYQLLKRHHNSWKRETFWSLSIHFSSLYALFSTSSLFSSGFLQLHSAGLILWTLVSWTRWISLV